MYFLIHRVLDKPGMEVVTGSFGYLTSLYKVVDSKDGICYALRRVERVRTNHEMVVCHCCGMMINNDN